MDKFLKIFENPETCKNIMNFGFPSILIFLLVLCGILFVPKWLTYINDQKKERAKIYTEATKEVARMYTSSTENILKAYQSDMSVREVAIENSINSICTCMDKINSSLIELKDEVKTHDRMFKKTFKS